MATRAETLADRIDSLSREIVKAKQDARNLKYGEDQIATLRYLDRTIQWSLKQ